MNNISLFYIRFFSYVKLKLEYSSSLSIVVTSKQNIKQRAYQPWQWSCTDRFAQSPQVKLAQESDHHETVFVSVVKVHLTDFTAGHHHLATRLRNCFYLLYT